MRLQPFSDRLGGTAAHVAVGVLQIAAHDRKRQRFAVKRKRHFGHEFGIFRDNGVFLLRLGDDVRRKRFFIADPGFEKLGIQLLFQLRAVGRGEHQIGVFHVELIEQRSLFVIIFHLRLIERVACVERKAAVGE